MNNFWIPIDKKYIDDNLDTLMGYLRSNDCDPAMKKKTIKALQERTEDILNEDLSHPLGTSTVISGEELVKRIRIVSYCILAEDKPNIKLIVFLAHLLETSPQTASKQKKDLTLFVTSLIAGASIDKLGFSWNDVPNILLGISVFASKLLNTKITKTMKQGHFEKKGCLSVSGGTVSLAALNKSDFDKKRNSENLSTLFDLYNLKVMVPEEELPDNLDQFKSYLEPIHNFMVDQDNVKPSPIVLVEKQKTYKTDDTVTVRLLNVLNGYMNSVSVDPGYETIKGSFYYKDNYVPGYLLSMMGSRAKILLEQGATIYVRVTKQNHPVTPFLVNRYFEDFYYDSAENFMEDETICLAKAINHNGLGNSWLTEQGFTVYIKDKKFQDKTGSFANIKITDVDYDELTIYGEIVDDQITYTESEDIKFETSARWFMLDEFLLSGEKPEPIRTQDSPTFIISPVVINLLSRMIFDLSKETKGSLEIFKHLVLSRMLSFLIEEKSSSVYLKFQMDYLKTIVAFANNPNFTIPEISVPDEFMSRDEIVRKIFILNELKRYDTYIKSPEADLSILTKEPTKFGNIRNLVEASNLLNGVIPDTALDPIKHLLSYSLGVEDEYTSIISEKTDYGAELTGREFKSSIVYPPNNNMKPDLKTQLFNIMKPVIGMLNSDKGGDIYIGVNDTTQKAIPGQIAQDMDYLLKNKLITEATMDKYRLYLKYRIDEAFKEESGNAKGSDITAGRVDLIPEQSREGVDVLHISVKPYEYDIVAFNPEFYPNAKHTFLRTSASTIIMNDEKKIQIRDRKSRIGGSGINIIHKLEQAKRDGVQVILKDYQSKNSTKDRLVEAYIILVNQDVLICYELEKKENRVFKISRIGDIEVTSTKWKNQLKYRQEPKFDIFGMMDSENDPPIHIKLKLKNYAKTLLIEEYPRAKRLLDKHTWSIDKLYLAPDRKETWILDIQVYMIEGVGRFYLGLAPFIEILEGNKLKEYVEKYVKENFISSKEPNNE